MTATLSYKKCTLFFDFSLLLEKKRKNIQNIKIIENSDENSNEEDRECSSNSNSEDAKVDPDDNISNAQSSQKLKNISYLKQSTSPAKKKAEKKPCPSCGKQVSQLPRHLKKVHGWSPGVAKKATDNFNLRKKYTFKGTGGKRDSKSKDYHKRRNCPIEGCFATPKRLPAHLKHVHKMKAKSAAYKDALKIAKPTVPEEEGLVPHIKEAASVKEGKSIADNDGEDAVTEESENDGEFIHEQDGIVIQKIPLISNKDILSAFGSWLESADGGKKEETTSYQHKTQIEKLLERIDESNNISSIFNIDLIQERFLSGYAPSRFAPATIKSYLTSVSHFCDFWLKKTPQKLNVSCETIRSVEDTI